MEIANVTLAFVQWMEAIPAIALPRRGSELSEAITSHTHVRLVDVSTTTRKTRSGSDLASESR